MTSTAIRDLGSSCSGPNTIVDIDDDQAGSAGLQHAVQCRFPLPPNTIPYRSRQADHRNGDESSDHARENPVHASGDDQNIGIPFADQIA